MCYNYRRVKPDAWLLPVSRVTDTRKVQRLLSFLQYGAEPSWQLPLSGDYETWFDA